MIALPLRECLKIIKIDDLRTHPRTEATVAATAARKLARLALKYGVTPTALVAYARAEAAKEEARKNGSSSRRGREWRDYVNPPPADWFETSATHDGPRRAGVTTITLATGLARMRTYRWNGTTFPKPQIGKNFWFLFRTVAIDGLEDLMRHLKTATPFEYTILGEPIEDTPQQAKRRLGAKANGDRNTIHKVPRPYLVCDCDSLPNLGDVDVTTLRPEAIHHFAVAYLPREFQEADCALFLSGSHGTSPGKVKAHLWFWLAQPIGAKHRKLWLEAINVQAGLDQTEDNRVVDPAVHSPWQPIFCAPPAFRGAPDPVAERWHFIAGTARTVPVPSYEDLEAILKGKRRRDDGPGSGGAGGATGGWRGILEAMGGERGFFVPTKMAVGLYVRQFGADCDPGPFYQVYDRLIDELAAPERGRSYADARKKDMRNLMAFAKAAEAQKGRPAAQKGQGTARRPTLAEVEAELAERLAKIVDAAIAEAIAGPIRRVAKVALAQGLGDPVLQERLRKAVSALRVLPGAWSFPVGLGVGKTQEALWQTVRAVRAGLRVAYHGATHELLRELKARIDPTIRVEIWYGEAAETPSGPACPRHEERAILRRNGGDAAALCGSYQRGFCRFHEESGGATCHYRRQREAVAEAQVVLFAGGATLSDMPPEWTGRKLPTRLAVVDPETGEVFPELTVAREDVLDLPNDPTPPFDLVFVDEPVFAHQIHGLEEPLTEIGEADLTWLAELIKTKTCPAPDRKAPRRAPSGARQSASAGRRGETCVLAHPEAILEAIRMLPKSDELPEPEEERDLPGVRAWRARILWAFARQLKKSAPGFVTYADLATALAAARKKWRSAPDDDRRIAKALEQIAWKLIVRPPVDPAQDQRRVFGDSEVTRWNRLLLALRHAAAAAGAALRRKQDATGEEETGFLKVIGGALSVRWIEPMHPTWRQAPVVVLDATHHQEIAERFVPGIVEMPRLDPGPAVGSCHVRQVFDAAFALGHIDKHRGDEGFLRELATWTEVGLAVANGTGLLVAAKRLEEALLGWWAASPLGGVPEGLSTAHFNALRGRDAWKACRWLGIVGRTMPPEEDLRDLRATVDGQPAESTGSVWKDAVWQDAKDPNREWVREKTVPGREDGLEQALLDTIAGDELAQAAGRLRLVRRPLAGVAVDILTNHPVPGLAVDALLKLEEMMQDHDAEALAAARGIVFEPGAKGRWEALAVVVGGSAKGVENASQYRGARGDEEESLNPAQVLTPLMETLKGDSGVEPDLIAPPTGPFSSGRGHSALVLRLLASGTWTKWRLRLPGNRYTLPVQVRAAAPGEAETLVRRFFPNATLEPVDTPKRPRGRPPAPREADETTACAACFRAGAAVRG